MALPAYPAGAGEAAVRETWHDALNGEIVAESLRATWGRNPEPCDPKQVRRAPVVPGTAHSRLLKYRANGYRFYGDLKRLERKNVLGCASASRLPQPPLGATMGHGLRLGDNEEEFDWYFPPAETEVPWRPTDGKATSRAQSEAFYRGARHRPVFSTKALDVTLNMDTQRKHGGGRIVSNGDVLQRLMARAQ